MALTLYISIPCTFKDEVLTIKGLKLKANGDTPEKAYLECIKNTPYFTGMKMGKIISFEDFKGRDFMHIEVPFSNTVYEAIVDLEPFPDNSLKKKPMKSFLVEATAEETLKLGY
jgi:hypothetical protein